MRPLLYKALLASLSLFFYFSSPGQWKQDRFMIGTFMDPTPRSDDFRADSAYFDYQVRMVKDAYFNFLSGYTAYRNNSLDFLKFKLEVLSHYQMYSMYHINTGFDSKNILTTIQFAKNLPANLRKSFLGYFLYDEPNPGNIAAIRYLISRVKIMDANKLAYVNFFPVYWFNGRREYEMYLDSLLIDNPVLAGNVASYDFYPFPSQGFRHDYYYNLSIIRKKASNRPFWFYVLTTPFGPYNDPTLYQLSFMTFNPICYGAKGYLVFTYTPPPFNKGYQYQFGNAILARDGLPTDKLNFISLINRYVNDILGPVVMKSQLLGPYHISNETYHQFIADNEYLGKETPVLSRIGNENMLAGVFRDTTSSGDYYVFLVNKSPYSLQKVFITFKGDYENELTVSPSFLDYETGDSKFTPLGATYDRSTNETYTYLDFAPGEGRLVKVINVTDPIQPIIEPETFNFTVAPNPFRKNCKVIYSLPEAASIRLSIYSLDGRLQQEIIRPAQFLAGKYYYIFNPTMTTTGVYLMVLHVNNKVYSRKIIFQSP